MGSSSASAGLGVSKLDVPLEAKRVLLHSCCAPCSVAIVECLLENEITPVLFFFNPNIFGRDEYLRRRDECARHASRLSLTMLDGDSDWESSHSQWLSQVKGLEREPERGARCLQCFKIRLLETAKRAVAENLFVFTTTLASSRWKCLTQISEAGNFAQTQVSNSVFWDKNWRKGGLQPRRNFLLKQFEFYNQSYCGCEFSQINNNKYTL